VYDEGIYQSSFRVVNASSREEVAQYILTHYDSWEDYLSRSIFYLWLYDQNEGPTALWESMGHVIMNEEDSKTLMNRFIPWVLQLSPQELLTWADRTHVDGDSHAQLAIHEITEIEEVSQDTAEEDMCLTKNTMNQTR